MSATVRQILHDIGPSLSSNIARELVASGMSPVAARQAISRSRGTVRRLSGIGFPNREKFLFLEDKFGGDEFREALAAALIQTRSAYGRALIGLNARDGAMPLSQFAIATGLAVAPAKRQIPHSIVDTKLREFGLIRTIASDDGEIVSVSTQDGISNRRRAAIVVEDIALGAIRTWLIKLGWSSSNALRVRDRTGYQQFGQFAWDIVGPSYLAGLIRFEKNQLVNGFIVGDIVLDRIVSEDDLSPFISKWDALNAQERKTRFQPMFIGDGFSAEALNELRKRGTLIAMPSLIFGEEAARDLQQLVRTIENAAAAVSNDPGAVFGLLERLSKIEGASLNLRGIVLELIVAHLYKSMGYEIDIRQRVFGSDHVFAEIDVKAKNRQEVVCVECKGTSANNLVDEEEINDWVDTSLKRIKHWLSQSTTLPNSKRFEFYSATGYTPGAQSLITKLESKHKKQPIRFLNGDDVIKLLQRQNEKALVDAFREQFKPK